MLRVCDVGGPQVFEVHAKDAEAREGALPHIHLSSPL